MLRLFAKQQFADLINCLTNFLTIIAQMTIWLMANDKIKTIAMLTNVIIVEMTNAQMILPEVIIFQNTRNNVQIVMIITRNAPMSRV
jgi:hypothetical protein